MSRTKTSPAVNAVTRTSTETATRTSTEAATKTETKNAARSSEDGFAVPTTVVLLIPLLLFAALATDIGSWFVEGQRVQRAADAGALAGVVWLPDEPKAAQVALQHVEGLRR